MIGNYFPVGIVLSSRSYMCCFVCCPGRFEDFVVVIFYDTGHLLVAVVAHLHIVFVENLMKFILFPEVFLYKVEELLSNISLNAFIKRWFIQDYLPFSISALFVSGRAWAAV